MDMVLVKLMYVLKQVGGTLGLLVGGCLVWCLYMYNNLFRVKRRLHKQGIRGPPSSSFLLGNIPDIAAIRRLPQLPPPRRHLLHHDWPSTLFPHFGHWITQYGPTFTYSKATTHIILTTDVEMVKQVNPCTSFSLGKPVHLARDQHPLLGDSILSTSGRLWARQRKIIAPEFYADRVKSMVSLMVECTRQTLCSWESRLSECYSGGEMSAEMDVYPDMKSLTADVIARSCFGSNYTDGERIFVQLKNLRDAMAKRYAQVGIPGFRLLPTKINREIWKLEKEINSMILDVVKKRAATSREKDLLQAILEGAKDVTSQGDKEDLQHDISLDKFIVDNCKAIYFAGQETTAITTTWCLMLLAAHPDWQARARAEVVSICKDNEFPDEHMLRDMKILTMVIQETLRLYSPAVFVQRTALEETKLKDIIVPKGVNVEIPIGIVQRDPTVWGPDAHEFNPGRFTNGILGATRSLQAYLPFGLGPRTCAGQHFAMAELKVILCMVLLKFSFSLSPGYSHSPAFRLVVEPEHGIHLTVRKATH